MSTTLDCKDIKIRNLEFKVSNQFLNICLRIDALKKMNGFQINFN